jgi:transcriptional regulator with XRE-family HTH domain
MSAYKVERALLLKAFGEQLRTLRKQRNLAQERLAEVASLHRNEIGVLERGQGEPGLLTLLILADALEVPLRGLTEGVFPPSERRPARHSKGPQPRGSAAMTRRCGEETVEMTIEGSE